MKILQVCAIDLSVDVLLKPLIKESMKQGFEVQSACTDTGRFERLTNEGLILHNINIDRKISFIDNLKSVNALYKLIKSEEYDIVHVHTPIAAVLGRIAAKLAGVRNIIYTAHGFYFHEGMARKQYFFYFWIEKLLAKFCTDWLLLQSKEDYELCKNEGFCPIERIIHISNGVDVKDIFNKEIYSSEQRNELRKSLGILDNDVVFMFIGRLVGEKGIIELLEAFIKLNKETPNVKLLIVGDLPASERDLDSENQIKELLKSENVIATGFRSDIPELLFTSDVFVLPSYREGLPRSIIEAMAMELPIIATDIRGCREEVIDGENGFLVPKQDYQSLYSKMKLLAENQLMRTQMGRRSRQIAIKDFNERLVIEKQIELFKKLKDY